MIGIPENFLLIKCKYNEWIQDRGGGTLCYVYPLFTSLFIISPDGSIMINVAKHIFSLGLIGAACNPMNHQPVIPPAISRVSDTL